MLENNLENAQDPSRLIVYGGIAMAARNWESYHAIVRSLKELEDDETLVVQAGMPVAVFRTHRLAPRVVMGLSNVINANWTDFYELMDRNLTTFSSYTAGPWEFIGSPGRGGGHLRDPRVHRRGAVRGRSAGKGVFQRRARGHGPLSAQGDDHARRGVPYRGGSQRGGRALPRGGLGGCRGPDPGRGHRDGGRGGRGGKAARHCALRQHGRGLRARARAEVGSRDRHRDVSPSTTPSRSFPAICRLPRPTPCGPVRGRSTSSAPGRASCGWFGR